MENRILSLLPDETGKKLIITFGDGSTQSLPLDELARILASIGDLTDLDTTVKSSLVAAVNEVYGKIDADFESAILDFVSDHQADILALLTATDPTLTQANKPADAKATGDEIADLKEAITQGEIILTSNDFTLGAWSMTPPPGAVAAGRQIRIKTGYAVLLL